MEQLFHARILHFFNKFSIFDLINHWSSLFSIYLYRYMYFFMMTTVRPCLTNFLDRLHRYRHLSPTLPTIPTGHSNQLLNLIIIEWTSYPGLSVRDGTSQGTFTCLKWSLVPPDFKECCMWYSWKLFKSQ
jgi:hypothetical protein